MYFIPRFAAKNSPSFFSYCEKKFLVKITENMADKEDAITRVELLKKHAKQIISDKKKLEQVKPEILPILKNNLTQLIENIEQIQEEDYQLMLQGIEDTQELETEFDSYGLTEKVIKEIRNKVFCLSFFTQENIDNVSRITLFLQNIAAVPPLIIPSHNN